MANATFTPKGVKISNAANSVKILSPDTVKQGDTENNFKVQLIKNGVPVDLTGKTVTWSAASNKGKFITDRPASVEGSGAVEIEFTGDDQGATGSMRVEFKVTHADGDIEKFPAQSYAYFEVTRSLDDLTHVPVAFASVQYFEDKVSESIAAAVEAQASASTAEAAAGSAEASVLAVEQQISQLATEGPVQSINGQTGIVNGLALQADLDIASAQLAETTQNRKSVKFATRTIKKLANKENAIIVSYGDSITFGEIPLTAQLQDANNYPTLLQSKLRETFGYAGVTVFNEGHSGWETTDALNSLNSLVLGKNPDCVILMFGINDLRNGIDVNAYRANLQLLVERIIGSGADVILMSPTMILDTNNSYHKKIINYVNVVKEVASLYNVSFVNSYNAVSKLYENKRRNPSTLTPDNLHLTDYSVVADTVFNSVFNYTFSNTIELDGKGTTNIPLVKSPYIETDFNYILTVPGELFSFYRVYTDGSRGTYLRFRFFVDTPNMDLVLVSTKNKNGGQLTVTDNGLPIKTVDFFANDYNIVGAEDRLIENIPYGYHTIEFLVANSIKGQSQVTLGEAFLNCLTFRPSKVKNTKMYNARGGALGTLERMTKINDGVLRLTAPVAGAGCLLENSHVEIVGDKTLIIELEGKFSSGSGVTWFGNDAYQSTNPNMNNLVNMGYLFFMEGTGANTALLFAAKENNVTSGAIATGNLSIDYSLAQKIRIEHTKTQIKVLLNGVQVLTSTDTKFKSGKIGLYAYNAGSIEITRLEYCYV